MFILTRLAESKSKTEKSKSEQYVCLCYSHSSPRLSVCHLDKSCSVRTQKNAILLLIDPQTLPPLNLTKRKVAQNLLLESSHPINKLCLNCVNYLDVTAEYAGNLNVAHKCGANNLNVAIKRGNLNVALKCGANN